ncbi:hypothetical protein VDG1235_4127 [Verrucomicrobiia bacterium DG1235]|nr:hypothetical protein VDG1235_4127 [Verrucomicrobiae bacterium DG1235]
METETPKSAETVKGQIIRLKPRIEELLKGGFKLGEVHQFLTEEGVDCSFSTFKAYHRVCNNSGKKKIKRSEKKKTKPVAAVNSDKGITKQGKASNDANQAKGDSARKQRDDDQTDMLPLC